MKTGTKVLISLAAAALALVFAAFFQTLLMPLLALAAYMGAVWGPGFSLPTAAAVIGGVLIGSGTEPGGLAAAAMMLASLILMTVYIKRRFPHRYAVLGLAVLICVGQYLSMTLSSMLSGQPPYAAVVDTWDRLVSEVVAPVFSGVYGGNEMIESMKDISAIIPDTLMWACILSAEAASIGLVMLIRLIHRVFRTEPAPMARFCDWRLPHTALIGGGIMLAVIALVYIFRVNQANSIAYSLGLIVASMFAVQGMAYLEFVFKVSNAPKIVRVFAWVLPFLGFPYSLGLLAIIGIKEQITKKRPKVKEYLKEIQRMRQVRDRSDELAKYGYVREDNNKRAEGPADDNSGGEDPADTDPE